MVKIAVPHSIKHTFETAIFEARDLIVKAYSLTGDKEKQVAVLDLIEVFRSFTEEGKVIITRLPCQVSTPEPVESSTIKQPPPPPVAPAVPSYAQRVREGIPNEKPAVVATTRPAMKVLSRKAAVSSTTITAMATNTRPIIQASTSSSNTNAVPSTTAPIIDNENVIILVTRSGCSLPEYQAFTIRERINKILGKRAISRVHTSPKGNLVLSCMDASPTELILDQEKWEVVFAGWPIQKAQKVRNWPKMVVHGVATCIPIQKLNEEIETYIDGISTQGHARWLTKSPAKLMRASVVFCVRTEEQKARLIKTGVLIGGQLLKVVSYQ